MITWDEYMKGCDKEFVSELTHEIRTNAAHTIACVNAALALYLADMLAGPKPHVNSGWRPASVNAAAGGAGHSCHLTAEAVDLADDERRVLAMWSMRNKDRLKGCGIMAMERPEATANEHGIWVHWQTRSPGSEIFAYWPTTAALDAWRVSGKPLMVG